MQYSPQVAQFPPEVYQTAGTYQLGNVVADHGLSTRATVGPIISGILMVIVGGVFFVALNSSGMGVPIGLVCIVAGIVAFGVAIQATTSNVHVYACEQGLIYTKSNTPPQPMRWDS